MTSPARLQLVQALYQMDMTALDAEELINEFSEREDSDLNEIERESFEALLRGVVEHLSEVDSKLGSALAEGWRAERIDRTMRAILRAGLYEILFSRLIPASKTIGEYREIAGSFFSPKQTRLVPGVLERVAREAGRYE
ncbi:MAG: transcription antitermination factor NusB [Hyphomicrobiales bacterium]|nr:transcription antitermination factor NusB [Hyphomicrobiales bacterium]MCY4048160.1 transcription antitermination factor NusB [Hyphomicrobiales bacterium]MCY4053824.1 transcription antitermination factor NusB [Hyphomicrobiales bacterium]